MFASRNARTQLFILGKLFILLTPINALSAWVISIRHNANKFARWIAFLLIPLTKKRKRSCWRNIDSSPLLKSGKSYKTPSYVALIAPQSMHDHKINTAYHRDHRLLMLAENSQVYHHHQQNLLT